MSNTIVRTSTPAGSEWTRRQIFFLSRAVICGIVIASGIALHSHFRTCSSAPDIVLRTYVVFVGTVMAHESVHGHLAKTRAGISGGTHCSLPSMVPFTNFRRTHQLHHSFTNNPEKDPDHFMKSRNLVELGLRAVAMPHHWFFWLRRRGLLKRADLVELTLNYAGIFVLHSLFFLLVGAEISLGCSTSTYPRLAPALVSVRSANT